MRFSYLCHQIARTTKKIILILAMIYSALEVSALSADTTAMTRIKNAERNTPGTSLSDPCVVLRQKIKKLDDEGRQEEIIPIVYQIFDLLDRYEQSPMEQHADSLTGVKEWEERVNYCNFYRIQAYAWLIKSQAVIYDREQENVIRLRGIAIALAVAGLLLAILMALYYRHQRQRIREKNLGLAQQISEAIRYKELYEQQRSSIDFGSRRGNTSPAAMGESDTTVPSQSSQTEGAASPEETLFDQLCRDIRENQLFLDPLFGRQTIIERHHLSKEQVGNAFSKSGSYSSLSDFIRDCRLEHACRLLATTDRKVTDIALSSGFARATTFNHDFRSKYKLSPTEFRQNFARP